MSSLPTQQFQHTPSIKLQLSKTQKIVLIANGIFILLLCVTILFLFSNGIDTKLTTDMIKPDDRDETLSTLLRCQHREQFFGIRPRGDYWLLENYVIGTAVRRVNCSQYTTLVTYGQALSAFQTLPTLIGHWQAPVSIAIFAPGTDFELTLAAIHFVRNCVPQAQLMQRFVTFHIYFPYEHTPAVVPNTPQQVLQSFSGCNSTALPEYVPTRTYAYKNNVTFSANMAKNIAMEAANTLYVLVSDVTLIPGPDVSTELLDMLVMEFCSNSTCHLGGENEYFQRIYSISVFQLDNNTEPPNDVDELEQFVQDGSATALTLKIPLFISHQFVPRFDERIEWAPNNWQTWAQMYALCLENYTTVPVENAFAFVYANSTAYSLFVNETRTANDAALMPLIQQEYLLLYGADMKQKCEILVE